MVIISCVWSKNYWHNALGVLLVLLLLCYVITNLVAIIILEYYILTKLWVHLSVHIRFYKVKDLSLVKASFCGIVYPLNFMPQCLLCRCSWDTFKMEKQGRFPFVEFVCFSAGSNLIIWPWCKLPHRRYESFYFNSVWNISDYQCSSMYRISNYIAPWYIPLCVLYLAISSRA